MDTVSFCISGKQPTFNKFFACISHAFVFIFPFFWFLKRLQLIFKYKLSQSTTFLIFNHDIFWYFVTLLFCFMFCLGKYVYVLYIYVLQIILNHNKYSNMHIIWIIYILCILRISIQIYLKCKLYLFPLRTEKPLWPIFRYFFLFIWLFVWLFW